jgi:hypothetical protein
MLNLTKYKSIKYSTKINKNKIPKTILNFDSLDEFNQLYFWAKKKFRLVKATKSRGISYKRCEKFHERYIINQYNNCFELIIVSFDGCYRIILKNKTKDTNTVKGVEAAKEIYKLTNKYNIDLNLYSSDPDDGKKIKEEIESPHIEVMQKIMIDKVVNNVFHIDFKSSYASRIIEKYPEFKDLYTEIYSKRKENNNYYKHILTNSIGCFQSNYCPDFRSKNYHKTSPYLLAELAKTAINGTRAKIIDKLAQLKKKGFIPLLTNTDGIWYYSPTGKAYHDADEGDQLGNWQNDHKNCKFLMMSSGIYQYEEDGICKSVVRGPCSLDNIESDRDKWQFGDVRKIKEIYSYKFDVERGVYRSDEKN